MKSWYQEFDTRGYPVDRGQSYRGRWGPRGPPRRPGGLGGPWRGGFIPNRNNYQEETFTESYYPRDLFNQFDPTHDPTYRHRSREEETRRVSSESNLRYEFPLPTNAREREEAGRVCRELLNDMDRSLGTNALMRNLEEYKERVEARAPRQTEAAAQVRQDVGVNAATNNGDNTGTEVAADTDGAVAEDGQNPGTEAEADAGVNVDTNRRTNDIHVEEQEHHEDRGGVDRQEEERRRPERPREEGISAEILEQMERLREMAKGMQDGGRSEAIAATRAFMRGEKGPLTGSEYSSINREIEEQGDLYIPETFESREEMRHVLGVRIEELQKEENQMIPSSLLGYKLSNFNSVKGFDRYASDIARALAANRVLVGDYTRGKEIPKWVKEKDSRQLEPQSVAGEGDTVGRRVAFGADIERTGDRPRQEIHSTPRNRKESQDVSDCSHIGHSPEEEAKYEAYGIPCQFRKKESTGRTTEPLLSSTLGGQPDQVGRQQSQRTDMAVPPHNLTQGSSATLNPTQPSLMSSVPPGHILDMFTTFSGQESKYIEWRSVTSTLMRNIESEMQAILLKRLLKDPELELVGHIYHTDPSAVDDIWKVLDKHFGGTYEQAEIYMTKLQNWARNGAQCYDYKSLQHLYNLVQENYYGIVRLGAEHIGMAEAIGYAITPLLFGKSQREVNRLRYEGRQQFTMKKVLDIIEKHLQDLKRSERDADKLASNDPEELHKSYSERDLPFLRQGLYMDTYKGRGGYKGRNYDPNYKYKKEHYGDSRSGYSYRDRYKDDRYRDSSRDKYRDSSRNRYRDVSHDRYNRESSSDRYRSRDRYKEDRYRDSSSKRYSSQDKYKDSSRDRYRDGSHDRHNNRDSSRDRYSKYDHKDGYDRYNRESSRDRYSKYDYKDGYDRYNNRESSRDRYSKYDYKDGYDKGKYKDRDWSKGRYRSDSQDRYKDQERDSSRSRGRSPGRFAQETRVFHVSTDETKRGRDPTPGPGGRFSSGRSPSRQRKERPYNTFKCTLCLSDDHDVFDCKKYTADQIYTICNEKRYCYVCFLTGHGSANCKSDKHCTDTARCKTDIRHNRLLCSKFSRL